MVPGRKLGTIKSVPAYMKNNIQIKMVDEATKRTVASIPTLKTKAGPRDSDAWVQRLKEEYTSLIKVGYVLILGLN